MTFTHKTPGILHQVKLHCISDFTVMRHLDKKIRLSVVHVFTECRNNDVKFTSQSTLFPWLPGI